MNEYMLTIKGSYQSWNAFSAEEKQRIMEKYFAYVNRLKRDGHFKGGSSLKGGGSQLRAENGVVIVDGPFAETKEALTGYCLITAGNYDEAIALARECPALTHGDKVEVFELSPDN